MRKLVLGSAALLLFSAAIVVFQFSCKKEVNAQSPSKVTACDVTGTYSGRNLASTGASSTLTYQLRENNFAVGSLTPGGAAVTFGGYSNTCDSVTMSVYYTGNQSYYLLQGKLTANGDSIIGTFKNLTIPSDFGTFSIGK
jgi:hypothetical protein